MTDNRSINETVRDVLNREAHALKQVAESELDLTDLVSAIHACQGKVIVSGVGKSGLIARKISATFSGTATPSNFVHPVDALHGDIGTIGNEDLVLLLSNSGETEELIVLLPFLKRRGVPVAAMTCQPQSTLAVQSDYLVPIDIDSEADSFSLVPSNSTTGMLAVGDAIAIAVLEQRGFTREQFAELHPSGSLGRKLLLQVRDIMHVGDEMPTVGSEMSIREAVCVMGEKRLGVAFVVEQQDPGRLLGVFTDGDLRRLLEKGDNPLDLRISDVMIRDPHTICSERLAVDAVAMMQEKTITVLPVIDDHSLSGAIHLHDLLKAGLG